MKLSSETKSLQPVFLLVGPPAVGKSTTSKALAAKFRTSIHIPVDDIRDMVVSGLALPSPDGWPEELVQQISLARETVTQIATNYQIAGFAVVIDDFLDPNQLKEYQKLPAHSQTYKFLLYPSQVEAHSRNLKRSGDSPERAYIDEGIKIVYKLLALILDELVNDGWIILDTTKLSVEETVAEILKHSERPSFG